MPLLEDEPFQSYWVLFNCRVFNLSSLLESFSIVVLLSLSLILLLSLSICCVVESCSFKFSNQCCFTFNKDGHSNMICIMWSLFASFEMNESLNLKHCLIQINESKDEIVLVHLIIKSKHESEKQGER